MINLILKPAFILFLKLGFFCNFCSISSLTNSNFLVMKKRNKGLVDKSSNIIIITFEKSKWHKNREYSQEKLLHNKVSMPKDQ
jgi:hypothetical protein